MKNITKQASRGTHKEKSAFVVGVKLFIALISCIDEDAKAIGITRSGVIRMHLINVYRDRLPK